eukprot:1393763-Amorphochlora_amoeboformis.AAC.2
MKCDSEFDFFYFDFSRSLRTTCILVWPREHIVSIVLELIRAEFGVLGAEIRAGYPSRDPLAGAVPPPNLDSVERTTTERMNPRINKKLRNP